MNRLTFRKNRPPAGRSKDITAMWYVCLDGKRIPNTRIYAFESVVPRYYLQILGYYMSRKNPFLWEGHATSLLEAKRLVEKTLNESNVRFDVTQLTFTWGL